MSSKLASLLLSTLLGWLLLGLPAQAEVTLRFELPGEPPVVCSLEAIRTAQGDRELALFDPIYQHPKRYRAVELGPLLRAQFGERLATGEYSHLIFQALDGYASVAEIPAALEQGGWIAFADLDTPGWEPVGRERANPGPLYLVWSGADQGPESGHPWPWQLAAIRLVRFQDQYPEVFPKGAAADSPAYRGFLTFRQRCMGCHALNQQGGQIGPDLNAPRNVLSYRSAEMVKAFIRQPSAYRFTRMPDHTDLSDGQLDELVEYLWFMRGRSPH